MQYSWGLRGLDDLVLRREDGLPPGAADLTRLFVQIRVQQTWLAILLMTNRLVISDKEKEAVLKLDGPRRYSYFIKRVVDWRVAWGLWHDDGWGLFADDDGQIGFPVWPAREYADACAISDWEDYVPAQIPLDDLLNELANLLQEDRTLIAVFATPSGKGVLVSPAQLRRDLELECQKYE